AAGEALAAVTEPGEAPPTPHAERRDGQLLAEATLANAWDADSRAEMVLAALGLAGLAPGSRLTEICCEQRARAASAHMRIGRPPTWRLDEPTTHLDDEGAAFLTGAITSHPGPVLIASHDRAFLDEATRAQMDLDPAEAPLARPVGGVTAYTGGFSDYLLARFEARERWEHRFQEEQEELKKLRQAVRDSYDGGRQSAARA